MMHLDQLEAPKPQEMSSTEVAHAWQNFRKWCVERAIDAKATAEAGNIVSTAQAIAKYVIEKDDMEKPKTEEKS